MRTSWATSTTLFQFTPPRGGDKSSAGNKSSSIVFQFTPPRGGDDDQVIHETSAVSISIHAPAWGRREAHSAHFSGHTYFNSRPRVGATHVLCRQYGVFRISIHAPAWGRPCWPGICEISQIFQFTPPRGGDLLTAAIMACLTYFNSRPRVGATRRIFCKFAKWDISIHAPAWGRPVSEPSFQEMEDISIHAPAWGRRGQSGSEGRR